MEHKFSNYITGQKQRLLTNNTYNPYNRTTHTDFDNITTDKNLRTKLDIAFNDLDSLRKSLRDIKTTTSVTNNNNLSRSKLLNFSPSSIHSSTLRNLGKNLFLLLNYLNSYYFFSYRLQKTSV